MLISEECKSRYGEKLYNRFMVSFDALPLCATLSTYGNEMHFAVHGGISPEIENLYEIRHAEFRDE
jgi:serine/threonine-protein phosphatase 2B catalytic subunit